MKKIFGRNDITKALKEQLLFTGLRKIDPADIADLWAAIEPEIDTILEDFYARLEHFTESREFDQMNIPRLQAAQKNHWRKLFSFEFSPDYEESVRRVGEVHSQIGLEPEWYVSGYIFFLNRMIEALYRSHAKKSAHCRDLTLVLTRLIGIDMGLAMSAYQVEDL
ncbi:hypothetical protein JCM17960_08770 [Magnetospira thiophila]